MNPILELNGIRVRGSNRDRLKNIHLRIFKGERVALLGNSGAGKTSLLSVSNGSLIPDFGEVKWKGKDLLRLKRRERKEIGTLWQDLRLINELSVIQNINTGALGIHNFLWAIKNLIGIVNRQECISCLYAAGLSKNFITRPVQELSGGQKQRVAIARLLRQGADVILADEPLTGLDPKLVDEILNLLVNSNKKCSLGIAETIVVSIHRPELIKDFTRVVGLNNGQIVVDKPIKDLKEEDLSCIYTVK
ncbi:ATP-binding cassette domain-containing protein [Prochlorococcus sp. MIT 1300]|uniref:ATP-binding cassette domain-containing protein n=1 Tax=Prochlorococcus sp. MIT 1300 TaxID=3096218 RepID=UPI002A761FC7|nr:ATP-binding cassette domain-containing protein [Prochlorococcus sp. MIT 1300]